MATTKRWEPAAMSALHTRMRAGAIGTPAVNTGCLPALGVLLRGVRHADAFNSSRQEDLRHTARDKSDVMSRGFRATWSV